MYRDKYLKYKQKYLDAKNLNSQNGGAGKTKKKVTTEETIIDEIKTLITEQIEKIIAYWDETYEKDCKNNKNKEQYCEYLKNIINLPDEDKKNIINKNLYYTDNIDYIIKEDFYSSKNKDEFDKQNECINKKVNLILKDKLETELNTFLNREFKNNIKYTELELETVYKLINNNILNKNTITKNDLDLLIKFKIVNEGDYICNENNCSKQNSIFKNLINLINIFDTKNTKLIEIYNNYNNYKTKQINNKKKKIYK